MVDRHDVAVREADASSMRRAPVIEVMDDATAEILRAKTEVQRLRAGLRMWNSARVILRAAIRAEHPEWAEARVDREIAHRISHGIVPREPL